MEVNQHSLFQFLQTCPQPWAIVLVGLPLSGKDTLINSLDLYSFSTISRDQLLLESQERISDYRNAYSAVDGKELDKKFFHEINRVSETAANVIINATHLTRKRRRKVRLRLEKSHFCIALIMPLLDIQEFTHRNTQRELEEQKKIPLSVYESMLALFEKVEEDEGFEAILYWDHQ